MKKNKKFKGHPLVLDVLREGQPLRVYIYPVFFLGGTVLNVMNLRIFSNGIFEGEFGLAFYDEAHPSGRDYCDFEGLKSLVARKLLRTSVPDHHKVYIRDVIFFRAVEAIQICEEEEFLKEVRDILEVLNDRPGSWDFCVEAYEEYQKNPNADTRTKLRDAYDRVPKHLRIWLLPDGRTPIEIEDAIAGKKWRFARD